MIVELPLVILTIVISLYFFYKKKKELDKKITLLKDVKDKFEHISILRPSIHQCIALLSGNENFKKLYAIVSLKKDFCIVQILLSQQEEYFILKGTLKNMRPNFFINRKGIKINHQGIKYVKQNKINKNNRYIIYGSVSQTLLDFIDKYKFTNMYCTYIPKEIRDNPQFESVVYVRGGLELLKDSCFVEDFFSSFNDKIVETEKRFNETKKMYMSDLADMKEYEKLSFIERMVAESKNKNTLKRKN